MIRKGEKNVIQGWLS